MNIRLWGKTIQHKIGWEMLYIWPSILTSTDFANHFLSQQSQFSRWEVLTPHRTKPYLGSQSGKTRYCMSSFILNDQNRQIIEVESRLVVCLGLGGIGKNEIWMLKGTGFLFEVMTMFPSWLWSWLHNLWLYYTITELYLSNGWTVRYVNYILIKVL